MEQNPSWETNRSSVSQEFPRILFNPNIHYRIHKTRPSVPTQGYINEVLVLYHFLKTLFSSIYPSNLGVPSVL